MKQMEHRSEQTDSKNRANNMNRKIARIEDEIVRNPKTWAKVAAGKGIKMKGLTEEQNEEIRDQIVPDGPDIIASLNAQKNSTIGDRYTIWGEDELYGDEDDPTLNTGPLGGRKIKKGRKTKQRKPKQRKTKRGANIFSKYLRSGKNTKRKMRARQ